VKSLLARAEGVQLCGLTLAAGVHAAAAEADLQVHLVAQVRGDARLRSRSARLDGLLRSGYLLVTPAGEALEWRVGESLQAYGLLLPSGFLGVLAAAGSALPAVAESPPRFDPACEHLAGLIRLQSGIPGALDATFVDGIARMVVGHLARCWAVAAPTLDDVGRLSPTELARLQAHVDAHLEQRLSVEDLARVLDLGYASFARRLKAAIGLNPMQYLIQRRVECCKRLLTDPQWTLADIAYRAGFSNQAHFSTTFRAQLGVTPSEFRQRLRLGVDGVTP
jgi:AraC family transcriptional regulator